MASSHGRRRRRRPDDKDIVDAFAEGLVEAAPDPVVNVVAGDVTRAVDAAADTTSRALVPGRERPLYGSRAFFRRAAEELVTSTKTGRELAGVCFVKEKHHRVLLCGLKREVSGQPGRVPIDPSWGSVLWHTHPGLKGSLAAFSIEDLQVAQESQKPLLVIGFVGFSLDVLSTLAVPFGLKAVLASAGIKGLLALERSGKIPTKLLEVGVGARVCWPSGNIQPVLRAGAAPWQAAVDDMSFWLDQGVGAVERTGQRALREVIGLFVDRKR
jgi:hypothetical protein